MSTLDYKPSYRRRLPHIQPPGAIFFITFRLAGSIPASVLRALVEERKRIEQLCAKIANNTERNRRENLEHRRLFGKIDKVLDSANADPLWLRNAAIAQLVCDSLHHLDHQKYTLEAFCIMANHVHLVCTPLAIDDENYQAISRIMHSIKLHTALHANRILGHTGDLWQHENYDHIVRDEAEYKRIIAYVLNNPVKAGLVERAEDWKWSYSRWAT